MLSFLFFMACSESAPDPRPGGTGRLGVDSKADSSLEAVFLDFEFDSEFVTNSTWNLDSQIRMGQLLFTIGHLNGNNSVGCIDRAELSSITQTPIDNGLVRINYHVKLPVAWGNRESVPFTYELRLPRDLTTDGQAQFTTKYKDSCADHAAHDVNSGSIWYYYRPFLDSCKLDPVDHLVTTATVTPGVNTTTGKYPEYDKVWADNTLRVIAIFGKYEDGAKESSDAGIAAYNEFIGAVRHRLGSRGLQTTPEQVPEQPGVGVPDVTFFSTLADGKQIQINAFLVDNVRNTTPEFNDRYESLSGQADVIVYNGHAGLGSNIRALANKGRWNAGQYTIVFLNGCDTYAYIGSTLARARSALNTDDKTGSKYMDIVLNAMPAFFASDSQATMAVIEGLLSYALPMSYEDIFSLVDRSQVVMVTGEEDNVFTAPKPDWAGLDQSGTLTKNQEQRYATEVLPVGRYVFETSGSGDVDLYVRVGAEPTQTEFDCRPYAGGSAETCRIEVTTPTQVHVLVLGYQESSTYHLVGRVR